MSAGTRRNGTHKTGPFARPSHPRDAQDRGPAENSRDAQDHRDAENSRDAQDHGDAQDGLPREPGSFGQRPPRYTARHAAPRAKTARWAGKAAPAVAIAATLAAGAAVYGLAGGHPGTGTTAALSLPASAGNATAASVASADAAAAQVAAGRTSKGKATPSAPASPSHSPSATAQPTASATTQAAAQPAQAPAPAPSASASTGATTVSCSDTSSLLPLNVTTVVNFLLGNGYTQNAAAGIAGNIYQESKGDPESIGSGGGGLIGWTPLRAGLVTGDAAADLQTQLAAILTYNNGWSAYLPALNDAATPADAAYIYVTDFERAGIPAAATREASADAVAAACGI